MPNPHLFKKSEEKGAQVSASESESSDSIWLLDDDPSMLKAVGRFLKTAGFSVEKFNHPLAFLSKLKEARCRVAVVDIWMPDMTGLEVQCCLRRESPKTRVIFITGRDDPSVLQTARETGAFGILIKPFTDKALLELVQKATSA